MTEQENNVTRRHAIKLGGTLAASAGLAGCNILGGKKEFLTRRKFSNTKTSVETVYDDILNEVIGPSEQSERAATQAGIPLDTNLYRTDQGILLTDNLVLADEEEDSTIVRQDSQGNLMNYKDIDTLNPFEGPTDDPSSMDYNSIIEEINEVSDNDVENLNVSNRMENLIKEELSDWNGVQGYFAEDVTDGESQGTTRDEVNLKKIDLEELREVRNQIDESIIGYTSAINNLNGLQEGEIAQIEEEFRNFLANPSEYGENKEEVENPSNRFNEEEARAYLEGDELEEYGFDQFVNLASGGQDDDPDRSNLFEDMNKQVDKRGIEGVSEYLSEIEQDLAREAGVAFQARAVIDYVINTAESVNESYTTNDPSEPRNPNESNQYTNAWDEESSSKWRDFKENDLQGEVDHAYTEGGGDSNQHLVLEREDMNDVRIDYSNLGLDANEEAALEASDDIREFLDLK